MSVHVELVSHQRSLAAASTPPALGWRLMLISHPGDDTKTIKCMLDLRFVCGEDDTRSESIWDQLLRQVRSEGIL